MIIIIFNPICLDVFFNGFKINQDITGISSVSRVLTAFEALVQIWYKGTRNFRHFQDLKP